jgi:MFS family permease
MSETMNDPAGPHAGDTLDIRSLGRKARQNQISGNALMGVGLGLAVLAAALLLWAGIVTGPVRVALLLIAAALTPLRFIVSRVAALTLADGVAGATNSTLRRWLSHGEAAALLLAGGFCAFGSGHDMGPVLGGVCAGLLVLAGLRGPAPYWLGLYPTLLLGATAVLAAFEPAWGWRGQSFLVGLSVIAVVLTVHVLQPRAASHPRTGGTHSST